MPKSEVIDMNCRRVRSGPSLDAPANSVAGIPKASAAAAWKNAVLC
jgi:hypothetical protein